MPLDQLLLAACVIAFTLTAAILDWRFKRLPNWLTVSAGGAGLLFNVVNGAVQGGLAGAGWGLLTGLEGFVVGFGMLMVLWLIGSGGGGDVKYMGALGAWLGPLATFQVLLIGMLITVALSLGVLISEAMRLGFGRARARYATAPVVKTKGSAEAIELSRQKALVRRRLMPWAVPAGIASWIVLAWMFLAPFRH